METVNTNPNIPMNQESEKQYEPKEKLNLILFLSGKLASMLGTYIYSFAISLYILKATGSGMSFAFSILLGTLPRVLLSPIAGSVADRIDRKKMTIGLDLISGIVVMTLLGLSLAFGLRLSFIYAATCLLSIISTFFSTTDGASIPRLVSDKNLVKINSYSSAIDSSSQIAGPVLGGLAFGLVSINVFLLINGISFILSAVTEMFIDFNFNSKQAEQKTGSPMSISMVWQDIKEVFAYIKGNKILCIVMPFSLSVNFLFAATFSVTWPFLINEVLGMSSSQYGFIEGAFSAGMLMSALFLAKLPEREKKLKSLVICMAGIGVITVMMGIPGLAILKGFNMMMTFGLYVVMTFTMSFLLLMMNMPMTVLIQRTIPNEMLGRVWGVIGTISGGLTPLGVIVAGIALGFIPASILFFLTGAYLIGAAVFMYKNKAMQEY